MVNKTDLMDQLAERFDGDKKSARVAVEGFIDLAAGGAEGPERVDLGKAGDHGVVVDRRVRSVAE